MPELLDCVVEITSRYNMFARGDRVGVAVSGGADSLCLLLALAELAPRWNLHLTVLHLNHCLRGDAADEDARFVEEWALRLGLPFVIERVDVAVRAAQTGDNLEQAARRVRTEFYRQTMTQHGLQEVATGHTRSDQAETVLFRFLRGAGTAGLAGILPVTIEGVVRPLLTVDRQSVQEFLRSRKIEWREDATNQHETFARNRIRHHLMPQLMREWNPNLPESLARTAVLAREDEEYWIEAVSRAFSELVHPVPPALLIRADQLADRPVALRRRIIRKAIEKVRGDLRQIEFDHIDSILALTERTEGNGRFQAPGVDAFRSFEWLRIAPPGGERQDRDYEFSIEVPATVPLPGGVVIKLSLEAPSPENFDYNREETDLDWECVAEPLVLRNWRPGDRYRPAGRSEDLKIKALFQEARVPLWERRHWPVITAAGQIVWARQFGPSQWCAISSSTRSALRVHIFPSVR